MRILYLHRTSAQDGSAVHIDGLVEALRAQGHEVILVAPPVATMPSTRRSTWLQTLRRRLPRFAHELLELAYNVPEAIRLVKAVRLHAPDLLYERSNLFTISGALVARRFGLPRITEVNAPYFLERSRYGGIALTACARWTEHFAWRRADAVVPVTSTLARIVEEAGAEPGRIHVMSNGVDHGLLQPTQDGRRVREELGWRDYLVLGFTGYVRAWNRLESVVELLAMPGHERMALLVVGDGTARASVEALAERWGVQDRVRFTGLVPRTAVARWVSAFDIALQPAANPYASPLKLFEYMALGRAIVAPDQPNIREVVRHEREALLFDPAQPDAFAAAIARLAADEELRRRIAAGAADAVRARDLTWSNNARRVADLAGRLQDERRARALDPAPRPLRSR